MTKRTKRILAMMSSKPKLRKISGLPPLTYTAKEEGTLKNYRIYGQTVDGESVGDRTGNLFDKTNFIQTNLVARADNLIVADPYTISTILPCNPNTKYTISKIVTNRFIIWGCTDYPTTDKYCNRHIASDYDSSSLTFTTGNDDNYLLVMLFYQRRPTEPTIEDVKGSLMFNYGEALPYEPYGYKVPVTVSDGTDTLTTNLYLPEQIRKVGDEAEYIDFMEQKQHFADGTSVDVTLPALPTLPGTNVLSVETEVQPSSVEIEGRIKPVVTGGG